MLATSISVIEHIQKDKEVLKELSRVIRKNGFLIISIPGEGILNSIFSKIPYRILRSFRAFGTKTDSSFKRYVDCFDSSILLHKHWYSSTRLINACKRFGFKLTYSKFFGGLLHVLFWELTKLRFLIKKYTIINLVVFSLFRFLLDIGVVKSCNRKPALVYLFSFKNTKKTAFPSRRLNIQTIR